ncbi:T104 [Tupaiid betaherpesvirus 1]|uniref:T104 n=1 Tax=Tupaiid herpesvirus 1 (strain 1) TaxID=10397 RepID=Q91TJ9_TUHV1|nr:T104 [Tupaiid betaherpesvirus 1]AAK57148.1 T104 [Tupaiid betaherpesvirus 1]
MERNQSGGSRSAGKRSAARDLTLSTIHSILTADDMLRMKFASYLDARGADAIDVLFPTPLTLEFFQILHGVNVSGRGQTIHQVLRDPTVFRKQIFYGLCVKLFNSATVRQVSDEWNAHASLFDYRAYDEEDHQEYLRLWAASIRHTLQSLVGNLVKEILYTYVDDDVYSRYIDWRTTLGLVPVQDLGRPPDAPTPLQLGNMQKLLDPGQSLSGLATQLVRQNLLTIDQVVDRLRRTRIPNSTDLQIVRHRRTGALSVHSRSLRSLRLFVAGEPLVYDETVLYTTPVAHLYGELLKHDSLCRHQKFCQLLNTYPVKAVVTSRHELNSQRIVELMERHDKTTDAKKSIMRFLLNISESKSKIGIEDSVESFIQDLTPSIIDQSRLLPGRPAHDPPFPPAAGQPSGGPDRDVRDLFRKQMIKCLEEQVQSQMNEIEELKLINRTWERKVQELHARLPPQADRAQAASASDRELYDSSTREAVRKATAAPFRPLYLDDNTAVANSFFSQYVPDTAHSDRNLQLFWEDEYLRTFKLRRQVTNQGAEDNIAYSNYTIDRVLTPFLVSILRLPELDPIPEEHLFLSLTELTSMAYARSRLDQYVTFLVTRQQARRRHEARAAAERATARWDAARPPAPAESAEPARAARHHPLAGAGAGVGAGAAGAADAANAEPGIYTRPPSDPRSSRLSPARRDPRLPSLATKLRRLRARHYVQQPPPDPRADGGPP